jgi:hypothetical protein
VAIQTFKMFELASCGDGSALLDVLLNRFLWCAARVQARLNHALRNSSPSLPINHR